MGDIVAEASMEEAGRWEAFMVGAAAFMVGAAAPTAEVVEVTAER
jgi:hypothetical protein